MGHLQEQKPGNALGMLDYYNREQYGDWPTLYGQNYTAYLDPNGIEKNEDGSYKTEKTGDTYEKDATTGQYRKVGEKFNYVTAKNTLVSCQECLVRINQ